MTDWNNHNLKLEGKFYFLETRQEEVDEKGKYFACGEYKDVAYILVIPYTHEPFVARMPLKQYFLNL